MYSTRSSGCVFLSDGKCEVRCMTRRRGGHMSFIQRKSQCTNVQGHSERREKYSVENHYLWRLGEEWADGNGKGMIRTEKKSSVLWLERQSEKKEGGWERAWERKGHMKACCINGKVKSLRINYPIPLGITNVIIWMRVLIRMCRGVEDLWNKMGDRDGAARV